MLGAAATADPVHVVLPHRDVYLGGIMHLVGALDADIACLRQLRPTPTAAFRSVRHLLIRHRHPWQRVARCALLLATSASPALRPPRKIIAGGRHGGVPAVSRGLPFQPPYPLLQRDVRLTQPRDRRGLIPTQGRSAPRAAAPPIRAQSEIITKGRPAVTHRHAQDHYPPECLPELLVAVRLPIVGLIVMKR